jgi:FtsP/CotA-like multicopper oxidase with cupredoxin domain
VEWRWVNANDRTHPMHLHGFYYEVLGLGGAVADSDFAPAERPVVVTQRMPAWTTMRMRFVPHTPGTWVFHCHILFHIETAGLQPQATEARHAHAVAHGMDDMRGLVIAMDVRPRGAAPPLTGVPRRIRVLAQARPRVYGDSAGYGFVVQHGVAPAPDSVAIPGLPIVLTRGELSHITVVNRLPEATAVHWHGMELPSYYDGVTGLSGNAAGRSPSIAPGDSFTAIMQPPRAGTFIYHTHLNDIAQAARGLYGPLIVLQPGQRWDPETDIVLLHSQTPDLDEGPTLLNGRASGHAPLMLRAGVHHRFRLIGFPVGPGRVFALVLGDGRPASWRALAKDGADLPAVLATERPARQRVVVGETYDFDVVPRTGEPLRLELRTVEDSVLITVPVIVR